MGRRKQKTGMYALYLVEVSEKQRALLANALHLRKMVVLQRARAVRSDDEALQELYRYVQRHQTNLAP